MADGAALVEGGLADGGGFGITARARAYLQPLVRGEAPLPYGSDGLPKYVTLKNVAVKQKLPAFEG